MSSYVLVWFGIILALGLSICARAASYIGVAINDITPDRVAALKLDNDRGVEVLRVREGSPADKAGIHVGDVLLTYNGETILGARQLIRLVSETPEGRHVKIQYLRDGKTQTAVVLTTAAPQPLPFDLPPQFAPFAAGFPARC